MSSGEITGLPDPSVTDVEKGASNSGALSRLQGSAMAVHSDAKRTTFEVEHGSSALRPSSPVVKHVKEVTQVVQAAVGDLATVRQDFEPMEQFYFLRADAQEIHGLQDWSTAEWATHMQNHPMRARTLLAGLLGAMASDNLELEASAIRSRLSGPMTMTQWKQVIVFQNEVLNFRHNQEKEAVIHYMSPSLLSNMMFENQFPLGVEEKVMREKYRFAVRHSGLHSVKHRQNTAISCAVYAFMVGGIMMFFIYMIVIMGSGKFSLEDTIQDMNGDPDWSEKVVSRGRSRGRVASLLNSMTFSLFINASLDKFGLIDPSTSTVLIGMTLGGTWGFILDMIFGTDEGFREYLWSAPKAMEYAMGCLASERYGRYLITILFDMFFTVILFKLLYSKLVQLAGFTVQGREWIANGFVSVFLGVLTFEVYANMTRFQWAYPSGIENHKEPWISGPTMLLCAVIMNMVYLTTETRTRVGEPGINDPNIKIVVTCIHFCLLWLLIQAGVVDPSDWEASHRMLHHQNNGTVANATNSIFTNVDLPLLDVCLTRSRAGQGLFIFVCLTIFCLGFVIFVTAAQSYSGLKATCCCCCGGGDGSMDDPRSALASTRSRLRSVRNPAPVSLVDNEALPVATRDPLCDRIKGQVTLFFLFGLIVIIVVVFFTYTPFYSAGRARNDALWRDACDNYDKVALDLLGLS